MMVEVPLHTLSDSSVTCRVISQVELRRLTMRCRCGQSRTNDAAVGGGDLFLFLLI
jgi:hypothetical protein